MRKSNRAGPQARTMHETSRAVPDVNLAESPLAWLARRKDKDGQAMISDAEFQAGERLRADFWFAHMTPSVTANWSRLLGSGGARHSRSPDHGADIQDHVYAAKERVRRALRIVGPDLAGVLIDVCCHLKGIEASEQNLGLPKRAGRIVLQIALRQLARHYGLLRDDDQHTDRSVRVNHWGDDNYRPRIDGGQIDGPSRG